MRAAVLSSFGGPDSFQIEETPSPVAHRGERLIRLKAAALNWHDVLVRQGRYDSPLPHVPGAGFDVVLDTVGDWAQSLRALKPGGRLVVLGASQSESASLDIRPYYFGQYSILGTTMGSPADFRGLLDLMIAKDVAAPLIDRAYDRLTAGENMPNPLVRVDSPADGVRYLTLDQPETRNALSDELLDELLDALATARDDDTVRVVVITSSHDRIFSSGGDLKAFGDDRPIAEKYVGLNRFPRLYTLIGALGKPVICAANGDVLAGAFGIALACDLVIAKESAKFGCPEINVGVFPFMISALIYRNISRMKANELIMLGDLVSAAEAVELGFVNRVVADTEFEAETLRWAMRLASKSPLLMHLGKQAINASRDMALDEALSTMQAQLALAFATEDMREGVSAFREKRDPNWRLR